MGCVVFELLSVAAPLDCKGVVGRCRVKGSSCINEFLTHFTLTGEFSEFWRNLILNSLYLETLLRTILRSFRFSN